MVNKVNLEEIGLAGNWPAPGDSRLRLTTDAWEAHKGGLAAVDRFDTWAKVTVAYINVRLITDQLERVTGEPVVMERLEHLGKSFDDAVSALTPLIGRLYL